MDNDLTTSTPTDSSEDTRRKDSVGTSNGVTSEMVEVGSEGITTETTYEELKERFRRLFNKPDPDSVHEDEMSDKELMSVDGSIGWAPATIVPGEAAPDVTDPTELAQHPSKYEPCTEWQHSKTVYGEKLAGEDKLKAVYLLKNNDTWVTIDEIRFALLAEFIGVSEPQLLSAVEINTEDTDAPIRVDLPLGHIYLSIVDVSEEDLSTFGTWNEI